MNVHPALLASCQIGLLFAWNAPGWAQTNQAVYIDALRNGWQSWSWAAVHNTNTVVHSGSAALAVHADAWEAAYFHHEAQDASVFTNLTFWIHGGPSGGQRFLVQATLSGKAGTVVEIPTLPANQWRQITVSMAALGVAGQADFDGFWIQDRSGTTQSAIYLDDITLIGGAPPPPVTNQEARVLVDAQRNVRPINVWIYGTAFASSNALADLNCPLHRSGGNSETRYNWQLNAANHGMDWYFESIADSPATAGAAGDAFVRDSLTAGAEPMLTIPMIGWLAKIGPNRSKLASFSIAKYGPQTDSDAQWFPDAGNGISRASNAPITGNDPNDANVLHDSAFQQGYVQHLTNRWGTAVQGGVRFFLMDNEPSLWHSTHRDVHPTGATMGEIRDKFFDYASAVKNVDAGALVCAPEEWGWSGYFYSGFDQQYGSQHGWVNYPDRATNGGWDYLPWFLDQARRQAAATGRRLLDVFTVHYYPQSGEFGNDTTPAMQLKRNRSTRSLWDTNYTDASWISDKVRLIPRLRAWVDQHYPGTKTGITEYNWGAENHINGATAQADLLGIFGREGLDMAARWTTPTTNTPTYKAMRMYRNYDGQKSTFGDVSVHAEGTDPDVLAVFAARRTLDGALTLMAINKSTTVAPLRVALTNFAAGGTVQAWQLTAANQITRLPDTTCPDNTFATSLPGQSITLHVLPAAAQSLALRVLSQNAPGSFQLRLEGTTGIRCVIEASSNLLQWQPLATNTLTAPSMLLEVPRSPEGHRFFRARK